MNQISVNERGTVDFPQLANYAEVAALLKLSKSTIYKMVHYRMFPPGVYLRHGRFNLTRLKEYIERNGTFLTKAA